MVLNSGYSKEVEHLLCVPNRASRTNPKKDAGAIPAGAAISFMALWSNSMTFFIKLMAGIKCVGAAIHSNSVAHW